MCGDDICPTIVCGTHTASCALLPRLLPTCHLCPLDNLENQVSLDPGGLPLQRASKNPHLQSWALCSHGQVEGRVAPTLGREGHSLQVLVTQFPEASRGSPSGGKSRPRRVSDLPEATKLEGSHAQPNSSCVQLPAQCSSQSPISTHKQC
jgi:hypothetical protein